MFTTNIEALQHNILKIQKDMQTFNIDKSKVYNYFLGITGSGKSSAINYLLSDSFLEYQKIKGGRFQIKNPKGHYPQIGHYHQSCTVRPEIYRDLIHREQMYVDPPGFIDTKGLLQEIINGYCNARMFQRGTKVKIIIVIEYFSLQSGRGGNVIEVVKRLSSLLKGDFKRLLASTMILVTKVPLNQVDEDDILLQIAEITQANQKLSIECKHLLQQIVQERRVFILPTPPHLKNSHLSKFKNGIINLKPTIIKVNASVSLSEEGRLMIKDLFNLVSRNLEENRKDIGAHLLRNLQPSDKLEQIQKQIKGMKKFQDKSMELLQQNFESGFQYLAGAIKFDPMMTKNVIENMKKVDFCLMLCPQIGLKTALVNSFNNSFRECMKVLTQKKSKLATKAKLEAEKRKIQEKKAVQDFMFLLKKLQLVAQEQQRERRRKLQLQKHKLLLQIQFATRQCQRAVQVIQMKKRMDRQRYSRYDEDGCQIM